MYCILQLVNGSCTDINQCAVNSAICSNYTNTYCANIQGLYECRCDAKYGLGGKFL